MDDQTKEILSKITREKWNKYKDQLVLYAESKCNKWTWKTGNKENLPKGYSPQSIAMEAISRLLCGIRNWNHEVYPGDNPIPFLKSVVDSIVSDLGRSKDHQKAASLETERLKLNNDGLDYEAEVLPAEIISKFNTEREATAYQKIYFKQIDESIMTAIQEDEDLIEFYRLKRDSLKLPVIAVEMGKTEKEIEALRVKFSRRTEKIRKEFIQETEQINRIPEGGARVSTLKKR